MGIRRDPYVEKANHVFTRPTSLLQYAHHMHYLLEQSNRVVKSIHAESCVGLNLNKEQMFVNPAANLMHAHRLYNCFGCVASLVPQIILPFSPRRECAPM